MGFEVFDTLESVLAMYAGLVAGVFFLVYWLMHALLGNHPRNPSQMHLSLANRYLIV